jgi:hypothetical protein
VLFFVIKSNLCFVQSIFVKFSASWVYSAKWAFGQLGFDQTGIRPDEFRPNEAGPLLQMVKCEQQYSDRFLSMYSTRQKLFAKNQTEGPGIKIGHFRSTISTS